MKKSLILTSLLFICILANLSAETVKEDKARLAAQNWYRHYAPDNKKSASVASVSEYKHNDRTAFYIYNFDQGGFVLVSANDAATPVLGYGFDHGFLNKNAFVKNNLIVADSYSMTSMEKNELIKRSDI